MRGTASFERARDPSQFDVFADTDVTVRSRALAPELDTPTATQYLGRGISSLVQAQFEKAERALATVRECGRIVIVTEPPAASLHGKVELLKSLRRERLLSRREERGGRQRADLVRHLFQATCSAASLLVEVETRRALLVEQAQSVDLLIEKRLTELQDQLWSVASVDTPAVVARHAATDVAFGLVSAVAQKQAVARELAEALRLKLRAHAALKLHDHALTCVAADLASDSASLGAARSPKLAICAAPAARLILFGGANQGMRGLSGPNFNRLRNLVERNCSLWTSFSKPRGARLQGRAGADPASRNGGQTEGHADSSSASLLHHGESRIRLLGELPQLLQRVVSSWWEAAHELRQWRRCRFVDAAERWLGKTGSAQAVLCLLNGLSVAQDRPLPPQPWRGMPVRAEEGFGVVASSTREVCKVLFDGGHTKLMPFVMLRWVPQRPHPAVAGLCLRAWLLVKMHEEQRLVERWWRCLQRRRARCVFLFLGHFGVGDAPLLLCVLRGWRQSSRAVFDVAGLLRGVLVAWSRVVLQAQCSRAEVREDRVRSELQASQAFTVRLAERSERLFGRLRTVFLAQDTALLRSVLLDWQHCVGQARTGRAARHLVERSVRFGKEALAQDTVVLASCWKAWVQGLRAVRVRMAVLLTSSLRKALQAWKNQVVRSRRMVHRRAREVEAWGVDLTRDLEFRAAEFERLHNLAWELHRHARGADEQARRAQVALQAADYALVVGAAHGAELTDELSQYREAFRASELRASLRPG